MSTEVASNTYLERVMQDQEELEADLRMKARKAAPSPVLEPPAAPASRSASMFGFGGGGAPAGLYHEPEPAGFASEVRITGMLWWRSVVVPPNAFVVHTRRGHDAPLHIGLGVSFRFNPRTDAFLVVPSAMQTILIRAHCICAERQGLVVQGYVQWAIDDFATAYHKLDFSDEVEPMRLVNLQLREQAEAAIKDTVATMSIDAVLTDKQPIIEELTARLRAVAEGSDGGEGLGLRIVTVQIKEAVVCSSTVWETLQRPFRAERKKQARLQELDHEQRVKDREAQAEAARARAEIAAEAEVRRLRAEAEAEAFARAQAESAARAAQEAEALAATEAHERTKREQAHALAKLELEQHLELERAKLLLERARAEQELELEAARRRLEDPHSQAALRLALIERLPELAQAMPRPQTLHQLQLGEGGLAKLLDLLERLGPSEPAA